MGFKMKTGFLSFKIKAIAKEPKKETKSNSSLITGIIVKDGENYFVKIKSVTNPDEENKLYQLTEQSYSLYDRTVVYTRKPDKKGVYTVIIKTHNDAKLYFEGEHPLYLPFKPNIKVKGRIKNINGVKCFDLAEVCNPESYILVIKNGYIYS